MLDSVNHIIDESLITSLSPEQAWHYRIFPIKQMGEILALGIDENSNDHNIEEELEMILGMPVKIERVKTELVNQFLEKHYNNSRSDSRSQNNFYTGNPDDFLQHLIKEARALKSSDIHIESYEEFCRVRIRIDGMLLQRYLLQKEQYPALINKIKIIAHLDIAEKRLPQDGRILFENDSSKIDIRVSVIPTLYGEKVVLRLLSNDATKIDLSSIGLTQVDMANYLEGIKRPNGIVLICGPTGSGKTTTLYATLKLLNKDSRNILTIEDPIEYTLEGINQVQLKDSIGLTFAAALRTFLRQDPDIIMVGEIRDSETADMAIRAALTGHLVLSTIHTNSAWGIISRLIDMGVPPFLIANTLNTAAAQRLIRVLCPNCKRKEVFAKSLYPPKFKAPKELEFHYVPVGCSKCHNTGYKGRKAIFEVIAIDEELAFEIKNANYKVDGLLKERNIKTLSENAFEIFQNGDTSIDEIYPILVN
ncbi:MAG: type II/IV secretion system protein [Bacteroidetes bacterium]|nr:type II/IV secretion system protein [Bacteroidota bacterium]